MWQITLNDLLYIMYNGLNSSSAPLLYKCNSTDFTFVLDTCINENKMSSSVSLAYLFYLWYTPFIFLNISSAGKLLTYGV